MHTDKLWVETPLIRSVHISSVLGCDAYLKLETLQPSQSFKYRGITHFAQHALRTHGADVHLVVASSGNAGISAACAANALSQPTVEFMRREGAEVVVVDGGYYFEALESARAMVAAERNAVLVPSYDHPVLWEGHASLVEEIRRQLPAGVRPDAIFCSVGGGGLAGGIMTVGCKSVGWDDVPLVTVETHGSNCFYQSLGFNDGGFAAAFAIPEGTSVVYSEEHGVKIARLSRLTSRASSLGASAPSAAVVKNALEREGKVRSVCVPDEMAMQSVLCFAEDHKTMVELACSVTLAPAYNPAIFKKIVPRGSAEAPISVVFVLCGGFKISLEEMEEYRRIVAEEISVGGSWEVAYNGEVFNVPKMTGRDAA